MIKVGDTVTGEIYGPNEWDWTVHHYVRTIVGHWTGKVVKLTHYMDNSTEATILCEDGSQVNRMVKPPSGDICY